MLSKILQKTKDKPCSCPSGKICSSCKSKKLKHPHVIVKDSRRLSAPITLTYYNPPKSIYRNNPTIEYLDTKKNKIFKRNKNESSIPTCTNFNFCRWYKRRKALKELKKAKKEEEAREKRKREEVEKERLRDFIDWEKAKQKTQSLPPPNKKKVYVKEKSSVRPKPRPKSKYVTAKKLDPKNSISNRFVDYCYRVCCQLCCCVWCAAAAALGLVYFA